MPIRWHAWIHTFDHVWRLQPPWVLYKTQFSLLDSTCLMSTSTSLINKNVKTYRTTAFFLPKHGKTILFFISSCFLLHSEPSGIQPGGRPHATRWTRPSWRRTKAEPGPCYREPPSHLCHLCHGRTLWSQDVSSIFYFLEGFYLYICMAMCKPSLTFRTLNLSVHSTGSSSQLWWRKTETTKYETTNQPWFKPMFTRICRTSTPHVLGGSTGSPSLILNPPLTVQLSFPYYHFRFANEPHVLLRKLLKNISVSPSSWG